MTESEQLEFLRRGRTLQVATNGHDGYPHLTAMWYWLVEDRIHFNTYRKSQKTVNLLRDPRIACMLESGSTYGDLRGLVIQGAATIVQDPEEIRHLDSYRRAYPGPNPLAALTPEQRRRSLAKRVVVAVEPVHVYSWDHRQLGGGY